MIATNKPQSKPLLNPSEVPFEPRKSIKMALFSPRKLPRSHFSAPQPNRQRLPKAFASPLPMQPCCPPVHHGLVGPSWGRRVNRKVGMCGGETWFCFSGDFLFLALLRYLLGIIFYFFQGSGRQIQGKVLILREFPCFA